MINHRWIFNKALQIRSFNCIASTIGAKPYRVPLQKTDCCIENGTSPCQKLNTLEPKKFPLFSQNVQYYVVNMGLGLNHICTCDGTHEELVNEYTRNSPFQNSCQPGVWSLRRKLKKWPWDTTAMQFSGLQGAHSTYVGIDICMFQILSVNLHQLRHASPNLESPFTTDAILEDIKYSKTSRQ